MERKSGLGFGFFNKARTKRQKKGQRSERQMAEMYDKVAIRGSIKHVWGDERPAVPGRSQTMPVVGYAHQSDANVFTINNDERLQNTEDSDELAPAILPRNQHGSTETTTAEMIAIADEMRKDAVSPFTQSPVIRSGETQSSPSSPLVGSVLRVDGTNISPSTTIHKKFSFCPSTLSLMSQQQSPTMNHPRRPSGTPYSVRSSVFSTSTPELHDHVSIADGEEEQYDNAIQVSPSNSLHYSNSIISRISSTMDSPHLARDDKFLPGTIYAHALPDALRGYHSVDALPLHYDEEDETSSISGLSEVNADHSDSEFDSASEDGNHGEEQDGSMITTNINDKLRRDSVKRVSYTQLENGDYLVAHKRRSRNSHQSRPSIDVDANGTTGDAGVERTRSDASQWSIERTYVSGGI